MESVCRLGRSSRLRFVIDPCGPRTQEKRERGDAELSNVRRCHLVQHLQQIGELGGYFLRGWVLGDRLQPRVLGKTDRSHTHRERLFSDGTVTVERCALSVPDPPIFFLGSSDPRPDFTSPVCLRMNPRYERVPQRGRGRRNGDIFDPPRNLAACLSPPAGRTPGAFLGVRCKLEHWGSMFSSSLASLPTYYTPKS